VNANKRRNRRMVRERLALALGSLSDALAVINEEA
jgi:hypothetical protein